MNLEARSLARVTGGWVERLGEAVASGVSVDSRTLALGDVFVALRGPRFDGHQFAAAALEQGAAGLVLEDGQKVALNAADSIPARDYFIIRAPDTLRALGDMAAEHRRAYAGKVVAVTGSNGKTTTKEMTATILSSRWKTFKSPGNFNNLVGVPLSIFQARQEHQALVLEAGMNRPGEIARLADIIYPDVGVITCVAPSHLEILKDIDGVKEAKGELLERLKPTATAVLNADDANVMALAPRFKGKVVTFGLRSGADIRAEKIVARLGNNTAFDLIADGRARVKLAFIGLHNVYNALAAVSVALTLGFSLDETAEGLARCRPLPMRLESLVLPGGVVVINDAYNANPGSFRAAVEVFADLAVRGRRIVVMGDMLELGDAAWSAHQELGRFMAEKGVDVLITVGEASRQANLSFMESTAVEHSGRHFDDVKEASLFLASQLRRRDTILVKGSRGAAMERLVGNLENLMARRGGEES